MKTERRQDLRTNELSTQLDEIGQYAKKNAIALTVAVIAVAAVTVGGFAYHNSQENRRSHAWNEIDNYDPTLEPAEIVASAEAVVADNISPEITVAALLRIGDAAMQAYAVPGLSEGDSGDAGPSSSPNWAEKAESAYTRILNDFADQEIGGGLAMIALGVLAENRGDGENARKWYDRVLKNKRLADTPFPQQAQYRLSGLDSRMQPIEFPPPIVGPMPDPPEVAEATAQPKIKPIDPPPFAKQVVQKAEDPASQKPKDEAAKGTNPPAAPRPIPTTMPADPDQTAVPPAKQ
ncbi:MAG: hypothetical protein ABII12_18315 [Planctomycetota bacterium]